MRDGSKKQPDEGFATTVILRRVMSEKRFSWQPAVLLPFALLTAGWLGSLSFAARRVFGVPRTLTGAAHNDVRGLRLLSSDRALHRVGPLCVGAVSGGEAHVRPRSKGGVSPLTAALR